jgi:hypothetical protein
VPVIEKDAKEWMPIVHQALPEDKRAKLKKVWNLWKDANVFQESNWKEMGACFSVSSAGEVSQSNPVAISKLDKAGITSGVREICIELHLAVLLHSISRTMLLILPLFVKTTEGWGFDTHAQTAQCYAMHFGWFTEWRARWVGKGIIRTIS